MLGSAMISPTTDAGAPAAVLQQDMRRRVAAAKTSFAAGMDALPPPRRAAMHALYAFCRAVDDIADDLPTRAERFAGLATWRQNIIRLFRYRQVDDPITAALLPAVSEFGLIERDFQDIIDGMAMDADAPIVAPDAATLDIYCDRVASAVGRVSVRIFGDSSPEAMQVAHHLGRALQMTNILRDLHEDSQRGRLYLPREDLLAHGLPAGLEALEHPQLAAVCCELAVQAATHYKSADTAMRLCSRRTMTPARLMAAYYDAILRRLQRDGWRDIRRRVKLPAWHKVWIILRYRY